MKTSFLLTCALFSTMTLLAGPGHIKYPLVVKFNSMGTGIPSDKPLLTYIAGFKKKYKIKNITYYRIGPMGREGEYHLAFPLKEMTKSQATLFIKEVKKVALKMKDRGSAVAETGYEYDPAAGPSDAKPEKKCI